MSRKPTRERSRWRSRRPDARAGRPHQTHLEADHLLQLRSRVDERWQEGGSRSSCPNFEGLNSQTISRSSAMSAACALRAKRATSSAMEFLDARRLTGPSLIFDGPGCILDVACTPDEADRSYPVWADNVGRMLEELDWPSAEFASGNCRAASAWRSPPRLTRSMRRRKSTNGPGLPVHSNWAYAERSRTSTKRWRRCAHRDAEEANRRADVADR